MSGFLLVEDAVRARKQQFDDWIDEQQRNAQQAQQAAQDAAARAAQDLQARTDAIRDALAASAPPTPPEPPPAPTPPPAPSYAPPRTPEVDERSRLFDGWVQQQQSLQDLLQNAQPPGKLAGGFTAPDLGQPLEQLSGAAREALVGAGQVMQQGQDVTTAADIGAYHAGPPRILRGPGFLSDEELLAEADPEKIEHARRMASLSMPRGREPTDADVANSLRDMAIGTAVAATHTGTPTGIPIPSGASRISPAAAMRAGGAIAGGIAGEATTPEDAGPLEHGLRIAGGVGAGLAAPSVVEAALTRPQLNQTILESLRRGGITAGPPQPGGRSNLTGQAVDVTKQFMLTDPIGRVVDIVGNTIELLRQPVALTMGGQGREAAAGLAAVGRAMPEAIANTRLAMQGWQVPTLGQGAQHTTGRNLIFKILSAGDIFTRTLGEYQGMAARGVRMLRDAGIDLNTPQAEQYLAQHADELYREGAQSGATSVFGQARQAGQASSKLDQMMARFGDVKENLLNSSSKKEQAIGALFDLEVPFQGTPSRVWQIGIQRIPGITQVAGVGRIARAMEKGDTFAAQKALGELSLESMIQAQIANGIREGNITGPDDPEHPSSVQIAGQWVPMRRFGVYGAPMAIMAAFAESWEKTGREPDPEVTDRFAAALNASIEPLVQALPGFTMVQTLAGLGRGGFTRAVTDTVSDAVTRITSPAILALGENIADPYVRDIARTGPGQLFEPSLARNPVLARFLPPKLDPTTGEPMARGYSVLGGASRPSSPLTAELARLERKGYALGPPEDRPRSVSVYGVSVPVKDGSKEQRAMVAARGKLLAELGQQIGQPGYVRMTDDQKARMWSSLIDRSAKVQAAAWLETADPDKAARVLSQRRVVGRLVEEDETERINREVALTNQMRRARRDADLEQWRAERDVRRRIHML